MAEAEFNGSKQGVDPTARPAGQAAPSEDWLNELSATNEQIAEEFCAWLVSKGRGADDAGRRSHRVLELLELAAERDLIDVRKLDLDALSRFVRETVPRSACVKAAEVDQQLGALESFFPFLQETKRIPDAAPFQKMVKRARPEAVEAASDESRWDVHKLLYMRGTDAGHDMDDPDQVAKFVATLNANPADAAELEAALRAAATEEQRYELPSGMEPYRREQPKVGRNDPCPCGSGKKFKKCCGD